MSKKSFTTTIDTKLQEDFKKACKENNDKMNVVLEAFMEGYVSGELAVEKEVKYSVKNNK